MKLPQPFGPVWNLRLLRKVALLAFIAVLLVVLGCLITGHFKPAGAFTVSAIIFGFNWQFVRHLTLRLEKWSQRPGFRNVSPSRHPLTGNARDE